MIKEITSTICLNCLELCHNMLKTKHLFGDKIGSTIDAFIKISSQYNLLAQERKDAENIDFVEVFQKSEDLKTVFEDFLTKILFSFILY